MKLAAIRVENYRSIVSSRRLHLSQSTVLVGPNNEGKSNVLRALVAGMQVLTRGTVARTAKNNVMLVMPRSDIYVWERDFPVSLQSNKPDGQSIIGFEFELNDRELQVFRRQTGSSLNGVLPIEMSFGNSRLVGIRIRKPGRGAKSLIAKTLEITRFVGSCLELKYIGAVRTAGSAERVVREMVAEELASLETDKEYTKALDTIEKLQSPILKQLSDRIKETLVQFLPDVKSVTVDVSRESRLHGLRECEIRIDDGSDTELQYKGDGVQSLAALGITRYASEREAKGKNLIIAIEEPESHLHPNAIHELREVLYELAQMHQLIITTHCPLLVNRSAPSANIIVQDNKARPAKSIQDVREILGVRASDNLTNAELILVVEGEEDRIALTSLLRAHSSQCNTALNCGKLTVDSLGGASNLSYKLGLYRSMVCPYICFLDADAAGKKAVNDAVREGLLAQRDVVLATCQGQREAEIEDLYDPAIYQQMIMQTYNVNLHHPKFKGSKKWSERMSAAFANQGKDYDTVEAELKQKVAGCVAANPTKALLQARRGPIDALIRLVVTKLGLSEEPTSANAPAGSTPSPMIEASKDVLAAAGPSKLKLRLVNGKLTRV